VISKVRKFDKNLLTEDERRGPVYGN